MARMNVNPTRMELKKLKTRLNTAVRGHKLLKDKSDEMIRRFTVIIRENKRLREEAENELGDCLKQFSMAVSTMSSADMEKAFSMPVTTLSAHFNTTEIMNGSVPSITVEEKKSADAVFPYSFAEITSEADYSIKRIGNVLKKLLALAEKEKTAAKVAGEVVAPDQAQRLVRVLFAQGAEHLLRHVDARDAQVREPGKEGVQLQARAAAQVQHVARVRGQGLSQARVPLAAAHDVVQHVLVIALHARGEEGGHLFDHGFFPPYAQKRGAAQQKPHCSPIVFPRIWAGEIT